MIRISILCVGSLKESYWKDAVAEYVKRLRPYCKMQITEVADERIGENASEAEVDAALKKEADRLFDRMDDKAVTVALVIAGKRFSSEALAARLSDYTVSGVSHVQFVIGGSCGLHGSLLQKADLQLSFSDMTFPHQMMRVILLEQIYRCFKIQNGEPYHK